MFSIIIYSSDAYSDCWNPFFKLFKKYFPLNENHEIILLTNVKKYQYPGLNIISLANGMDVAWSKRLRLGVEKAKNTIIFLIGDDFFLLSKVNQKLFNQQLELIVKNNKVDHIRLLHKLDKFKFSPSSFPSLSQINKYTKYRFLYAPSLWKKTVLLKYIVDFESPFMAEKMGTYRSWVLNHGFYCLSEDFIKKNGCIYNCGTSGVIAKGKWEKWAIPKLKEENLDIDFLIRGIKKDYGSKTNRNRARLTQLLKPISTFKSYSSVFLLVLKSIFSKKL